MTNEMKKFMVNKNVHSFQVMKNKMGTVVKVVRNQMVPNRQPEQTVAKGQLNDIKDFEYIVVGGKLYNFANRNEIIVEVVEDKTNEVLYDASLVVNRNTKFNENTRALLGLVAPNSKVAYSATKQYQESLNK